METNEKNTLYSAILKLLRPLVRILLRNGIPFKNLEELVKWLYVDVAAKEFSISGRKQSDSRISIITGLSRKEIRRLKNLERLSDENAVDKYNRAARVIAGWRRDSRFCDTLGRPKALVFEGEGTDFKDLVKQYSGDVPPRAILDELINVGAVRQLKNGKFQLQARAYLPAGDEPALLSILGTDVSLLMKTIDHNIFHRSDTKYFQRKVAYDNLPMKAVAVFRELSAEKAQKLLEELDVWLAGQDRDTNPSIDGGGRRLAGMGIYYFEEDPEKDNAVF